MYTLQNVQKFQNLIMCKSRILPSLTTWSSNSATRHCGLQNPLAKMMPRMTASFCCSSSLKPLMNTNNWKYNTRYCRVYIMLVTVLFCFTQYHICIVPRQYRLNWLVHVVLIFKIVSKVLILSDDFHGNSGSYILDFILVSICFNWQSIKHL